MKIIDRKHLCTFITLREEMARAANGPDFGRAA